MEVAARCPAAAALGRVMVFGRITSTVRLRDVFGTSDALVLRSTSASLVPN